MKKRILLFLVLFLTGTVFSANTLEQNVNEIVQASKDIDQAIKSKGGTTSGGLKKAAQAIIDIPDNVEQMEYEYIAWTNGLLTSTITNLYYYNSYESLNLENSSFEINIDNVTNCYLTLDFNNNNNNNNNNNTQSLLGILNDSNTNSIYLILNSIKQFPNNSFYTLFLTNQLCQIKDQNQNIVYENKDIILTNNSFKLCFGSGYDEFGNLTNFANNVNFYNLKVYNENKLKYHLIPGLVYIDKAESNCVIDVINKNMIFCQTNQYLTKAFDVDLNSQWREPTKWTPTDDQKQNYVIYESYSNIGVNNGYAKMYIKVQGIPNFYFWINSYAEANYDYTIAFKPDYDITSNPSAQTTSENVYGTTYNFSKNPSLGINDTYWKKVSYTFSDNDEHYIVVCYRKDSSSNSDFDTGSVAIPKEFIQNVSISTYSLNGFLDKAIFNITTNDIATILPYSTNIVGSANHKAIIDDAANIIYSKTLE